MSPSGWFLLKRPAEETEQRGFIEAENYSGKVFKDGRVEIYYREDGKLYLAEEGTVSKNGEFKFPNTDGTYSYGFIDDQDHIETPYKGGWNNTNALTTYDNYTAL